MRLTPDGGGAEGSRDASERGGWGRIAMAGSVPSSEARREESKEFVRRGCDRALSASAVPSQSRELGGCRSISFVLP